MKIVTADINSLPSEWIVINGLHIGVSSRGLVAWGGGHIGVTQPGVSTWAGGRVGEEKITYNHFCSKVCAKKFVSDKLQLELNKLLCYFN